MKLVHSTYGNLRWCQSCNRLHGASYLCASYSEALTLTIRRTEDFGHPTPLPFGTPGNGTSQIASSYR